MRENRHLVLVVEDRKKWRGTLYEGLNRTYDVVLARTREAGIEQVRQRDFDAVILNPNLVTDDDFFGVDVLDAVIRHRPLMPCILLSGTPELQASQMGRYAYQIYALLSKGGIRTLLSTVENAIRDRVTIREWLSILDAALSDAECSTVIQELARYYTHLHFQAPPHYTDNTKNQRFAYLLSILDGKIDPEDRAAAMAVLCDIVCRLKPADLELHGRLERVSGVVGGILPALAPPPPAPPAPPVAVVRELMLAAFDAQTLRCFCQDRLSFQPLTARFSPTDGLVDMVARVMDFCATSILWDELLSEIEAQNPRQYARFESRLRGLTP